MLSFINKRITVLLLTGLLLVLLVASGYLPERYDREWEWALLWTTGGVLLLYAMTREKHGEIRGQLLRPSVMFLIGYIIVFFQYDVDLLLDIKSENQFYSAAVINRSTLYSLIGLVTFLLGYMTMGKNVRVQRTATRTVIPLAMARKVYVVATALYVAYNIGAALSSERAYSQAILEEQAGTMDNYVNILFITVYFSVVSMATWNCIVKEDPSWKCLYTELGKTFAVATLAFIVITLLIGERGDVVLVLMAYAMGTVVANGRKIGVKMFVPMVLVSAALLSVVGILRKKEKDAREAIEMVKGYDSVLPVTAELAGSSDTFNAALTYVPYKHDYLYGSFQVRECLSAIPFSSRLVQPFVSPEKRYHSSAFFCTYIIQGEHYTYGNGTSLMADLYLTLGLPGILIGMFLLGLVMRRVELHVFCDRGGSLVYVVLAVYFFGYAVYYSRASLLSPLNFMMFSLLFNFLYLRMNTRVAARASYQLG